MENRPVLAIETSASACGAAVYFSEALFSEAVLHKSRSHASAITTVIDAALKTAGCGFQDLSLVAVSGGPGSFTGLRIGLSTAKGICFGASLPLALVPTFDAGALEIAGQFGFRNEEFVILSKVNTTELFMARYEILGQTIHTRQAVSAMPREEVALALKSGDTVCAPENWFGHKNFLNFQSPKARFVAQWARLNPGAACQNAEIDYIEPLYGKDFIVKKKEKNK